MPDVDFDRVTLPCGAASFYHPLTQPDRATQTGHTHLAVVVVVVVVTSGPPPTARAPTRPRTLHGQQGPYDTHVYKYTSQAGTVPIPVRGRVCAWGRAPVGALGLVGRTGHPP